MQAAYFFVQSRKWRPRSYKENDHHRLIGDGVYRYGKNIGET